MIKVIDNIISKEEQEQIKSLLLDKPFPWYYLNDVSKRDNTHQKRPGLSHFFILEKNKINSDNFKDVELIIDNTSKKLKIKVKDILQVRSFLQLPLNKNFLGKGIDTPHIDSLEPHIVFLYYVCDSDGDTIIYDYKTEKEGDVPFFEDVKEKKRITPKQGRVVVFDGLYWHTAEQPKKDVRCILNFNISSNGT